MCGELFAARCVLNLFGLVRCFLFVVCVCCGSLSVFRRSLLVVVC